MAERLSIIKARPGAILDWWGDVGRAGEALLQTYPRATVHTVRATPHPQAPAARRWPWQRARPESLLARQVPPGSADLVWCNMALHFATDRAALPREWLDALRVDGFLMLSTFGPDTLRELRELYAAAGWGPAQSPFEDMHDIGDRLVASGFADPVMDQETLTLTYADGAALLAELRLLGGNLHPARHAGLRTPRWRSRWLDAVARKAGPDGRIAMTFEIAYGHAFKPAPRIDVAAQTVVKLEDMKEMLLKGSRP